MQGHLSEAVTLIKDSFVVDHLMGKHYLDTSPPWLKFVVLSAHRAPLSRQLHEVIRIGNNCDGMLNKENHFDFSELELYLRFFVSIA